MPLVRICTPEEIADIALSLASERASFTERRDRSPSDGG
jgi:hypothetical protein